jgi:hypothetical protein
MILLSLLKVKGNTLLLVLLSDLSSLPQTSVLLGDKLILNLKMVKDLNKLLSLFLSPNLH